MNAMPPPTDLSFAFPPRRSGWRFFPVAVILGLLVVVAVNGVFVWISLATFPGVAVRNSFNHSNNYDQAIAAAEREAALGWVLRAEVAGATPDVLLVDRTGQALIGAQVEAIAQRPLGNASQQALVFAEAGVPGHYRAGVVALGSGQWDLLVTARIGSDSMHATRRILVK